MDAVAAVDHRVFTAFGGARCEIVALPETGLEAVSAAIAEVYAFEERLSRFRPGSELSRLNAGAGARVAVSPVCEAVLRAAVSAWELTDGLVDAAVLPALIAAGYDVSIEAVRRRDAAGGVPAPVRTPPPRHPLDEALEVGEGWARVRAGCAIDLGGVGKGWLADRLAERLGDAVVSLGGDLRALGGGPGGEGWTVELCDGARYSVRDAGVATSGIAGRRWRGGHHLVDPRTGLPAATDVTAVSVVARDAVAAEALAKAAAILGADGGPRFALRHGALAFAIDGTSGVHAA